MDFSKSIKTITIKEHLKDYFSGECPFCEGKLYKIINSRTRKIQDTGGPHRKIIVELEVKKIKCLNPDCGKVFTPEHPAYPKNHQYSRDVIETALNLAHQSNLSAEKIVKILRLNDSLDISPKTVQFGLINILKNILKISLNKTQRVPKRKLEQLQLMERGLKQERMYLVKKRMCNSRR